MRALLEIIDAIPTIAWCARPDGAENLAIGADFS